MSKKNKDIRITFRASEKLKKELEKASDELDIPFSQLIREAIKEKIKK